MSRVNALLSLIAAATFSNVAYADFPAPHSTDSWIDKAKRGVKKGAKEAEKGVKKGAKETEKGVKKGVKKVEKATD